MNQVLWYLTRSTGIVAVVLAVAALFWGFHFSARATGDRRRPAWWLDLHNWLGGLALIFTGAHIALAWLNSDSGIGILQILVPNTTANGRWGITWGVLATYMFAGAVFTTWPRRLRRRVLWRAVHLSSVVGVGLALLHGYVSGTEASDLAFRAGLVALAGLGSYSLGLRLFGWIGTRRPSSQPAHSQGSRSSQGDRAQ
jgi:methionine sulfoxide reductase heme-binding subunit